MPKDHIDAYDSVRNLIEKMKGKPGQPGLGTPGTPGSLSQPASGGSGAPPVQPFANPMDGVGQMIRGGTGGALIKVPAGTEDQVLTVVDVGGNLIPQFADSSSSLPIAESDVTGLVSDLAGKQPLDADLTTIAGLVDPNADRILFWDDSAGAYAYLAAGTNLTITGTTIDAGTGGGGSTVVVQEGDSTVSTADTLDFDASDFNVSESPAGEANISLAYGTSAGTPAEGNHTHTNDHVAVTVTDGTGIDFTLTSQNITAEPIFAGTGSAGTVAHSDHTHGGSATITVQEGDSDVDTAVTTLDFDASDFNITSSPAGEANVALAYGTGAGTPAEGNHTHASILPIAESDVTNLTTDLAAKQPLDAELTAIAGLTSAADKLPYFTGSGTAALADLSAFVRTILDDADAATVRATIGAGTSSVALPIAESDVTNLTSDLAAKQGLDATLTALAGLNATAGLVVETAADTFTKRTLTGTANEITVTNGDGVSGNPTLSFPTGNVKQLSGLTDPNADRIYFWDDSAGSVAHLATGTGITISGTTISADAGGVVTSGIPLGAWVTGRYYALPDLMGNLTSSGAGNALVANTMEAVMFPVASTVTFDQVAINVSTLISASTIRLGVYAMGTDGLPGALIADWGTVSSATTGDKTLTVSWSPSPGWYYLVMSSSHAPSTLRQTNGNVAPIGHTSIGTFSGATNFTRAAAGSSTALPNPFGTAVAVTYLRPIWMRVA